MDRITIEITEGCLFKVDSDGISQANHTGCEGLIRKMAELAGGQTKRTLRPNASLTQALHAHAHDGHTHTTGH
jgi:hypothetical protein